MQIIAPMLCGLIFGAGLLISGMVQPAKVLGFLDVFGAWDPSLAVVMAAALAVSVPGFRLADRQPQPWFAGQHLRPSRAGIDLPLVVGAALFGIGWGLVGLCPGPALESIATLSPRIFVFVAAMAAGMILHEFWSKSRAKPRPESVVAGIPDG